MPPESDKWGWKHVSIFGGFEKGSGTKRWKCNYCNVKYNGSYSRVKAHLLGFTGLGVKSCPAIDDSSRETFQHLEAERLSCKKKKDCINGKPGRKVRASQQNLSCNLRSIAKEDVDDIVARFFYAEDIKLNVVNSPYFLEMARAIAAFGSGYEFPSIDKLSGLVLSKEKAKIEKAVALVKESWPHTGCTILCVEHTITFDILVSSPRGNFFLKGADFNELDELESCLTTVLFNEIMEIGPTNVVQMLLHLDHENRSVESFILSKFPNLFISLCSVKSICILMEEITEFEWIKSTVLGAKDIEESILKYPNSSLFGLIRNLKNGSNPLCTKFAPSYCLVQWIFKLKQALKEENIGIDASIMSDDFWVGAHLLLQIYEPFVKLLVGLNINNSVMGDIYNWRLQSLDALRSKEIDKMKLNQLEEMIENKWDSLFSPLHAAGYLLNPKYFGRNQTRDRSVMRGWKSTLERYECDGEARRNLREQLSSYWKLEGLLGEEDAVECRDKMDPVAWWENFGFEIPQLQTLAIKILSQVSSAEILQENWQGKDIPCQETGKGVGMERVEDLTFVKNNLRLQAQRKGTK